MECLRAGSSSMAGRLSPGLGSASVPAHFSKPSSLARFSDARIGRHDRRRQSRAPASADDGPSTSGSNPQVRLLQIVFWQWFLAFRAAHCRVNGGTLGWTRAGLLLAAGHALHEHRGAAQGDASQDGEALHGWAVQASCMQALCMGPAECLVLHPQQSPMA